MGRKVTNEISKLFLLDRIEIANATFSFSDVSPEKKEENKTSHSDSFRFSEEISTIAQI